MFTLQALQAKQGDCLILHYGTRAKLRRVLIDGGPAGVYTETLKPELERLRGSNSQLQLELVMLSHIDDDHVHGLINLLSFMKREIEDSRNPPYQISALWLNSFEQLKKAQDAAGESDPAHAAAIGASVNQGSQLRNLALSLNIPLNRRGDRENLIAPESGLLTDSLDGGLTFTIIGPHQTQLYDLEQLWRKKEAAQGTKRVSLAADYANRTPQNLSSIVAIAEFGGKSMLLTGDAGGDMILKGLKAAFGAENRHFNVLKLQHHGSFHSVDGDFFHKVKADHYVISGNGKQGNPGRQTLQALSDARPGDKFNVYLTYREGDGEFTAMLAAFLDSEGARPGHRYIFPKDGEKSVSVEL